MPTNPELDAASPEVDTEFEVLGDRLIDTTRRFMRSERRERILVKLYTSDGHELRRAQIDALEAVAQDDELRMNQLAERLRLDPSTVTRTVNPLVELGLVERFTDPENRRYVVLRCTKSGKEAAAQIVNERRNNVREILAPMAPERRALLVGLFDEYTTGLEKSRDASGLVKTRAASGE